MFSLTKRTHLICTRKLLIANEKKIVQTVSGVLQIIRHHTDVVEKGVTFLMAHPVCDMLQCFAAGEWSIICYCEIQHLHQLQASRYLKVCKYDCNTRSFIKLP